MSGRTLIRLEMRITSRWAVGGVGHATDPIDLPVLTDPRFGYADGAPPYVPGSTIAGSLKAHLGEPLGTAWLGNRPPRWEERTGRAERRPSALSILGVLIEPVATTTRGATAHDARRRAADEHTLRTEQWSEPTTLTVAMQHSQDDDDDLLDAIARWAPVVGRGRSAGMGTAELVSIEAITIDTDQPQQLTWWLTQRTGWLHGQGEAPPGTTVRTRTPAPGTPPGQRTLTLHWKVREPVHIGGADIEDPALPARAAPTMRFDGRHVVPGTTWKGIFRHRVDAILSALALPDSDRELIGAALFGSKDTGRGIVSLSDAFPPDGAAHVVRTHVAIDRFTGGTRDGALFQVEAIDTGAELPLTITYTCRDEDPIRTLLLHVARDIHEGLVSVGGHGSRGYGWLELDPPSPLEELGGVDVAALIAFALNRNGAASS